MEFHNFLMFTLGYNNEISNAFKAGIMPVMYDIGKVIFWCSSVYGVYYIIRRNYREGVDRLKWATIGYICLRLLDAFTKLVDVIVNNITF
jgi:hypothetical protein